MHFKGNNSNMESSDIFVRMQTCRTHHKDLFSNWKSLVKPNNFGDIWEKLLFIPYVLFLVTATMFFNESKIFTSFLTNNDDRHQEMAIAHMTYGQVNKAKIKICRSQWPNFIWMLTDNHWFTCMGQVYITLVCVVT